MAKDNGNMFGSFGKAAVEREQEQKKIEAAVTGKTSPEPAGTGAPTKPAKPAAKPRAGATGRPRKRVDATCMTVSISQADKDLVKEYAFAHAMTVSDLIHRWIQETCVEQERG